MQNVVWRRWKNKIAFCNSLYSCLVLSRCWLSSHCSMHSLIHFSLSQDFSSFPVLCIRSYHVEIFRVMAYMFTRRCFHSQKARKVLCPHWKTGALFPVSVISFPQPLLPWSSRAGASYRNEIYDSTETIGFILRHAHLRLFIAWYNEQNSFSKLPY